MSASSDVERREHGEGCDCVRCTGFLPGNTASAGRVNGLRHGAYSLLLLRGRADELAAGLREAMGDGYEMRFEAAVAGAAMIGARLERAMVALVEAEKPKDLARLDQDARGWMRLWLSALGQLGLTPTSAARLTVARTGDELARYLAEHYPAEAERDE